MLLILVVAMVLPALTLEVLEGDGAVYNLRSRSFSTPRLRVSSEGGAPIAGATVTFRLPDSGPGAVFGEGHIAMITTDAKGEAVVPALRLNSQLGQWEIHVTASHQGETTRVSILQINAAPVDAISLKGKRSRSLVWVAAIAAGAATAATIGLVSGGTAVRSGGVNTPPAASAAAAPPLSISAGAGSVSAP